MASACLNRIGISPESLIDCPQKYSSYNWFTHRLSISRETNKKLPDLTEAEPSDPVKEVSDLTDERDPTEFDGFEFRLDDPVIMLPADELFSDGKLVPLHLPVIQPETATSASTTTTTRTTAAEATEAEIISGVGSPDTPYTRRRTEDPYLFSPRAPRCSSRWKELLGFRKVVNQQSSNGNCLGKEDNNNSDNNNNNNSNRRTSVSSIRQFLNRNTKTSTDSSINLPLLKDAETESVTVSSRPSLSSSSSASGHDLDDLPRLSLDSDKPSKLYLNRPKTRMVKTRTATEARGATRVGRTSTRRSSEMTVNRGLSTDSPRMNSCGKIVFHSLERSSSSPSSFNGGPRFKQRGMERSYSANVRITPVLNVPVCSLSKSGGVFGFPIFSSSSNSGGGSSNRSQRFHNSSNNNNTKSRTDLI